MTSKDAPRGRRRGAAAHDAGPTQRQLRVAEEVRHAQAIKAVDLAALATERRDFRDPDLANAHVTVTEVRASPDLKHMTAFVSGLGKDVPPEQFAALRRAAPFLRGQVAKSVRLKFAPDLHFQPDTALDYAMEIDRLMKRPEIARDLRPTGDDPKGDDPKGDDPRGDDRDDPS